MKDDSTTDSFVTIIVPAYNSEATILQTLTSIANQTHQKLELLIADDASTDNTPLICNEWVEKNRGRFERVELIINQKNLGIVGNLDQLYRRARGDWIKPIAGDDLLLPSCLSENLQFISAQNNRVPQVVFSKMEIIDQKGTKIGLFPDNFLELENKKIRKQFTALCRRSCAIPAPSVFINREAISSIGFLDTRFFYIDDYSLWLKFLHNGIRLAGFNAVTVQYRQGFGVVSGNKKRSQLINVAVESEVNEIKKIYVYPFVHPVDLTFWYHDRWESFALFFAARILKNKSTARNLFILKILLLASPIRIISKLKAVVKARFS